MSGGPATPWGSMSAAEWRAANKKPKKSKYGNRKVVVDGIKFDSEREAERYCELKVLERDGSISDVVCQPSIVLAPSVRLDGEKRAKPSIRYIADFSYWQDGKRIVEDVKSAPTAKTAAFRIKRHLLKSVHGIDVRIVK